MDKFTITNLDETWHAHIKLSLCRCASIKNFDGAPKIHLLEFVEQEIGPFVRNKHSRLHASFCALGNPMTNLTFHNLH